MRILVVDDEPSICKALSAALTRAGYDVATAQSGEAALAIVRAEHIDVLLLDLRIPDMRGDIIFEVPPPPAAARVSDIVHDGRHHRKSGLAHRGVQVRHASKAVRPH